MPFQRDRTSRYVKKDAGRAPARREYLVPLLLLGINAEVIQLVLFREALMLSNGSEISLGLALASWALFNGAGALAAFPFGRGGASRRGRFFTLLILLLPLFCAGSIHLARVVRELFGVPGATPLRLLLFSGMASFVLGPVTFLDGFLFVSALDAFFTPRGRGGEGAAVAYGTESLGALAGGLIFTFFWVRFLDPISIAGLLACLNGLFLRTPDTARFLSPSLGRGTIRMVFFLAGVGLFMGGRALNARSEAARWRILQPALTLVEARDTPYQHLDMLRYREEYSLFGNGHLLFSLRAKRSEEAGDWNRAVFPHFAMLQRLDAGARVVLVGGGSRGYLADLLEHDPDRIDWVEVDRDLVDMASRFMLPEDRNPFSSTRVRFHAADGRSFIRRCPAASVDLVVLDVPDPVDANLNRYYTLEFFRACRRILRRGGALVLHMTCQPNFIGEAMRKRNGSVYAALRKVFPRVLVTPGALSFMAAGDGESGITADPEELAARYRARGIESPRFNPYLFYTWFVPDTVHWINEEVFGAGLKKGDFLLNRDDKPVAYLCEAQHHAALAAVPGEGGLLHEAETFFSGVGEGTVPRLPRRLPLLFLALGLLLALLAHFRNRRGDRAGASRPARGLCFLTALVTGFCGIVLEVGVLMVFQNLSGHLYSRLGLVIAAYMAGLSAGALLGAGRRKAPSRGFKAAAVCMAAGVGGCLLLSSPLGRVLPESWGVLPAFFLVTGLLGAAGGAAFRAVSLALARDGREAGGGVYALDILGTCLGGWQAGGILIPAFGIRITLCGAAALFMLTVVLCAWTHGKSSPSCSGTQRI